MNHLEIALFYTAAFTAIASSVVVVTNRRPTYGVLALSVTMFALSTFFVLLQAYFVAVIQILIYAGAILVLFLFVIMLLGVEEESLVQDRSQKNSALQKKIRRGILFLLLISFLAEFVIIISAVRDSSFPQKNFPGTIEAIGEVLFTNYLLPFELVSGILLIGIFGGVHLAQKELKKL